MSIRAFLAFDVNESVRRQLAGLRRHLDARDAKIRWVAAENIHLTLHFLGEVEVTTLDGLRPRLAEIAGSTPPFTFTVRGIEAVPPHGPLRMLWAGVEETSGTLAQIQKETARLLVSHGFSPEERDFRPHLTLARFTSARDPDRIRRASEKFQSREFGATPVQELILYQSVLTPQGPIYTAMSRFSLGLPSS